MSLRAYSRLRSVPSLLAPSRRLLSNYGTAHLGDALSIDGSIETVPLSFDLHSPEKAPSAEKSPLVFLHGIFGSKANTRTVAKQLASRLARDVYCLDLRNFGSSPHIERLDYPALAADVERFISDGDKFPAHKKPILVGHSMGAKTAMAVALRRPELPKMMVSVDNVPVHLPDSGPSPFSKYIRQLKLALEVRKYASIKDVDAELAKVEPSKEVRQFILTNVNRNKKDEPCTSKIPLDIVSRAITAGNIASWPFDSSVSRWGRGPALFVRGTESSYVPDETIPDIGLYFPDFEVRDVKAGHWLISENPKDFIEVLVDFIERKEDGDE